MAKASGFAGGIGFDSAVDAQPLVAFGVTLFLINIIMQSVPAICENCGTIFPSGIFGENSTIVIDNVRSGPCPGCGEDGVVPDAYYDIKDKVINIFANSDISIDRIKNIYKVINEAKNSQSAPEVIIDKIKNDAEELKSIFDLAPKTKSQLYGFLTLILTFIMAIMAAISMSNTQDKITKEDLKTALDQMEERLAIPEKKEPYIAPYKPGRNEICPCGSGKKYKRCCGIEI